MLTELAYSDKKNGPIEQRRLKRWQLVNYLRVFDASNGNLLGHLMDINGEGIMLLSSETFPCGVKFQLRMERLSDGVFSNICLTANSLWSKVDKDPHFYNTGFSLDNPGLEALTSLQQLIDELQDNHQAILGATTLGPDPRSTQT